jgi:hypothetical protein
MIKDIVISKGKKAERGPVHTMDITVGHVLKCVFPERGNEYDYLGYAWYNINKDGTLSAANRLLRGFFKQVDKVARPWWCPRFVLRLLHLFGSDNSIVRVRNWKLHNLERRLTKGIAITDTKWKYDSFRIYGYFTEELDQLAADTCSKIENEYEKIYE